MRQLKEAMAAERVKKLLNLIKKNPDLPILPFVDAEIVAEDSGWWLGSWGECSIDEYVMPRERFESIIFKSYEDKFDTLEKCLPEEVFEAIQDDEAKIRKAYKELPWTKAIVVYIRMPEV